MESWIDEIIVGYSVGIIIGIVICVLYEVMR